MVDNIKVHERTVIGVGRTAEVIAWTPGKVLKLYYSWWPLKNIEYEARISRAVHAAGVSSPEVGAVLEVEGRHGLVYERIDGPSMESLLWEEPPRLEELARSLARLHASMHTPAFPSLPSQRRKLEGQIERVSPALLDNTRKQTVLHALKALPDGDRLCHGDFHPGNVLMLPGKPCIIDWENASAGSPLADVARTLLLLQTAHLQLSPGPDAEALQGFAAIFRDMYLQEYIAITHGDAALVKAWHVPVAAARLQEGIQVEEEYLLAACG